MSQFNGHFDSNRFRPPKYKTRYIAVENNNLNRSQSSGSCSANNSQIAHAISFRGGSECSDAGTLPVSPNAAAASQSSMSCNKSHFEECFERLAKLGEGSFGEVFQVRDRSDSRLYAVKISKQLFRGEQYRAERLEEVRRYEEFSGHENCIRFIRAWEQYDRLFMQMELCRESLEQYLYRCRHIPEERIWHILLDLLRGLKSLHDRNLIHLDIKLDNVLIDDDDTCKLADFGLVIDVDKANNHQATEGDSRYMAPEILQGQFSKAADIFSLGIAMLELACYMDLPSNGPLWHELRQGKLPEEFINSEQSESTTINPTTILMVSFCACSNLRGTAAGHQMYDVARAATAADYGSAAIASSAPENAKGGEINGHIKAAGRRLFLESNIPIAYSLYSSSRSAFAARDVRCG